MAAEVLDLLVTDPDGLYVDGTLGEAGHAGLILDRLSAAGRLFGVDRDPQALRSAALNLGSRAERARLIHGNFRDLAALLPADVRGRLSGVLLDLGLRSTALDDPERGFTFQADGPLDMRFDPSVGESAAELLASLSQGDLTRIFAEGTTRADPRRLARAVVAWRDERRLATTGDLVRCLRSALGRWATPKLLASVFSAVRMEVNHELGDLEAALRIVPTLLETGGVLCVLAYQSQEDRRVKALRRATFTDPATAAPFVMESLTRRPLRPSCDEARRNRRARSARLRAFRRGPATSAS
jgi:16S rRNA (cytosine1402-N4)-methyltransferase